MRALKDGSSVNVSALAFIIRLPIEKSAAQWGDQSPMHEPTFVAAFVTANDRNRRGHLFRGNVKARHVLWEIAVKVPANPNVTELERSGEAATHGQGNLAP